MVGSRLDIRIAGYVLGLVVFSLVTPLPAQETTSTTQAASSESPSTTSEATSTTDTNLPDVIIEAPRPAPTPEPAVTSSPTTSTQATPRRTFPPAATQDAATGTADSAQTDDTGETETRADGLDPRLLLDQSITTFDEAQIRREDIGLLNDLRGRVPNLNASDANLRGFNNVYNLRGIGNTQFFSNPSVITYVDGVPLANAFAYSSDFYNLESIEVLRGPLPTLFGRNSSAGVINIRTLQPSNRYRANASISYGSFNTQQYVANASGPIVKDNVYLGLGGYLTSSDGYVYNSAFGREVDDRDGVGGRVNLRLTPTKNWDISIFADLDQYTDGDVGLTPLTGPRYVQNNSKQGQTRISRNTIAARATGSYDWGTVTTATARQWFDLSPNFVDIAPFVSVPFGVVDSATTTTDLQQEQYTTELRFASPADATAPVRWQAGLFYLSSQITYDGTNEFVATVPVPFPPFSLTFDNTNRTTFQLEEENFAVFGEVGIDLCETVELLVGLRLDYTQKSLDNRQRVLVPTGMLQAPTLNLSRSEFNPAPSIGAAWTPDEQTRVFWNTTYGFQSGGYSGFADAPGDAEFDTQNILANELGAEWRSRDEKVTLSATGFFYKIWDYQVERTTVPPQFLILNAPESRSFGVETTASYEPLPGLVFSGAFGYTNFEFERYVDPFTGQDYAGNTAPFVPAFNANTAVQYKHVSGAFARIEMLAFGETYYDEANTQSLRQGSYALMNLKVGWEGEHAGVFFVAENLTDTFYFTNITPNLNAGIPGAPQYVGFEVTGNF